MTQIFPQVAVEHVQIAVRALLLYFVDHCQQKIKTTEPPKLYSMENVSLMHRNRSGRRALDPFEIPSSDLFVHQMNQGVVTGSSGRKH